MVVQGPLNSFGVIGFAVTLSVVWVFCDINNLGRHGEFHLGAHRNCKKDNKKE